MAQQVPDTFLAQTRQPNRKGGARKLRETGWVPAVAYGPGKATLHLAIDPKTFLLARGKHGGAHIYKVEVQGQGAMPVLVKEVTRNPATQALQHIDLYAVDMNKEIRVKISIELVGKPAGVVEGGLLQQQLHEVEVQCLPSAIPQKIVADVSHLGLSDVLHVNDLTMPQGVKVTSTVNEAVAIITVVEEEAAPTPAVAEAVPAEGAAPAEGVAPVAGAAPAAAGAAPAASAEPEVMKKGKEKKGE